MRLIKNTILVDSRPQPLEEGEREEVKHAQKIQQRNDNGMCPILILFLFHDTNSQVTTVTLE